MKPIRIGAALVLCLAAPAMADATISLDPTQDPLQQGYETEGNAPYTPGTRLVIDDNATDFRLFRRTESSLAPGAGDVLIDVEISVAPGSVTLDGEWCGVQFAFDEGIGARAIRFGLIERAGVRSIGLQLDNNNFTSGIAVDWTGTTTVRLERRGGSGVVSVAGQEHAVPLAALALSARPSPAFEFGCASGPGRARLSVGSIGDPSVSVPVDGSHAAVEVGLATPNPSRGGAAVSLALPREARVRAAVFDVAGRRIRLLADGARGAGLHQIVWDGAGADDRPVGAALYLIVIEADGERLVRRAVISHWH